MTPYGRSGRGVEPMAALIISSFQAECASLANTVIGQVASGGSTQTFLAGARSPGCAPSPSLPTVCLAAPFVFTGAQSSSERTRACTRSAVQILRVLS